jgi:flagellar motility protein MotE (MotC chaperone)
MRIKDIIALGILALVSFPVVLLGVLMWTGNVRLAFGPAESPSAARERLQLRPEDLPETAPLVASSEHGTNASLMIRETELDSREAMVQQDLARLEELRLEVARIRDTIASERRRIDELLAGKDSLEQSRLMVLGRTFTGMKPDQAARIFAGLDDVLVTGILRAVGDDKPRAKLLAAMGKQDPQRAAAVARLLRSVGRTGESSNPPKAEKPASAPETPKVDSASPNQEKKP